MHYCCFRLPLASVSLTAVQCKHILAVQMARRLGKCIERAVTQDELLTIVCVDVDPRPEGENG